MFYTDFNKYIQRNILAWMTYDPNYEETHDRPNTHCRVYPRVLLKGKNSTFELIDPSDFPQKGCIEVLIQGGATAEEVCPKLGSLVSMRLNSTPFSNESITNIYSSRYNPQYSMDSSDIGIESFSGKGFYQVIDIDQTYDTVLQNRCIEIPSHHIYTTLILLRHDDKIYGPFEYDSKDDKLALAGFQHYQYIVGEYDSINYNDNLCIIYDDNDNEAVILLPREIFPSPLQCEKNYDWISETKLLHNFFEVVRTEAGYTREQIGKIKDSVRGILDNITDVEFTPERRDHIQKLIEKTYDREECINDIIAYVLETPQLRNEVLKELVDAHFQWIEPKLTECASVQQHIQEIKREETAALQHLEAIKGQEHEVQSSEIAKIKEELESLKSENERLSLENAHLVASTAEKDKLDAEIQQLREERDIEKEHLKKVKADLIDQAVQNRDLEKQFDETLKQYSDKVQQTAKVLDNKLLERILRGFGEEPEPETIVEFDSSLLHGNMSDKDIIERVGNFIRSEAHRDVTDNDVANYLICITQGFITTFAGEPGTGKTSLCNLLAKSLGLATDSNQKRFTDISVERGWTSLKDFIGYYNPLTKSMVQSNVDVYQAFRNLDAECRSNYDANSVAPYVVLLDEANLSPIEHYWAAFLRNCDSDSSTSRTISLGGTKNFKFPDYLRFVATVNFDHTTEELSPRFLDRSWIITLEPKRIDDTVNVNVDNMDDMISVGALRAAFIAAPDDAVDEGIADKWNSIQAIFRSEKCHLPIMPRNLKMVKNYCAVACRCMDCDSPSTKYAPLDYAFSQKILPTINGSGDNYRILVEELLKECTEQNMPLSAKHLKRMQSVADENMGFYQFFAR